MLRLPTVLLVAMVLCPTVFSQTKLLPHMEGKIKPGENYVYCATMQLAWQESLKILKGKPKFEKPCPMADILNRNTYKKGNLYPERYYVNGGFLKDGILEKIIAELPDRFADRRKELRKLQETTAIYTEKDFLCVSFLKAQPSFRQPFHAFESPLIFRNGQKEQRVQSFGVSDYFIEGDDVEKQRLRDDQVAVYDYSGPDDFVIVLEAMSEHRKAVLRKHLQSQKEAKDTEYAYEVIRGDEHVILAKIKSGTTLRETWEKVLKRMKACDHPGELAGLELVKVPKLKLGVRREYTDLSGIALSTPGFEQVSIISASQSLIFTLTETGAGIESNVVVQYAGCIEPVRYIPPPRSFVFDKPFLLAVRQDGKEPYLVMWIEDPSIMEPWKKPHTDYKDYRTTGITEAKADLAKGKLLRKENDTVGEKLSSFRKQAYKHLFQVETDVVKDLHGEALSEYLRGYNETVHDYLTKQHKVDIHTKVENLVKDMCRLTSGGDIFALSLMQNEDGSWGQEKKSRVFLTSLAVLYLLASGKDLSSLKYGETLRKGVKRLMAMEKVLESPQPSENFPGDIVMALALTEAYGFARILEAKSAATSSAARVLKRDETSSLWYLFLLSTLSQTDIVEHKVVARQVDKLKSSVLPNLRSYPKNRDAKGCAVAALTALSMESKIDDTGIIEYLDVIAPFNWEMGNSPDSRERCLAQTTFYLGYQKEQRKLWKRWNRKFYVSLVKCRKLDFENRTIIYPVEYPPKCTLSRKDYQLYSNLMAGMCLEMYYQQSLWHIGITRRFAKPDTLLSGDKIQDLPTIE